MESEDRDDSLTRAVRGSEVVGVKTGAIVELGQSGGGKSVKTVTVEREHQD